MRPARLQAQGNDVRALKAMLDAERDDEGGQLVVFAVRVRPKDGPMERRKLKLVTSWNAAGMFVVTALAAFASASTEARAMLVYSYYSSQIIVTTDERRSGPVDLPPEVGPSIAACWRAPHQGDQVTVQLSFRRDGSIFGRPRVNYVKPMNNSSAQAITESIFKALDACLPLRFTPRLAANIAGQVFVIRFVAP
jgi:hypothetical protein